MSNIQVFFHDGLEVVSSREVAEMVGKRHDHLIRDINGYVKIMSESTAPNFGVSDFFIVSDYKDITGRTLPCYLLTKKGCDMVANKLTGEKGVLFTAAYVTAFEKMREHITQGLIPTKYQEMVAETQRETVADWKGCVSSARYE